MVNTLRIFINEQSKLMNELSINFSCLNSKAGQSFSINDIRRGRSRILSLYKSQNIQDHPERRRSFLKVFSKQNKEKTPAKNTSMGNNNFKNKDPAIKKILDDKVHSAYLFRAQKQACKEPENSFESKQKLRLSKALEKEFFSERVTLQPRRTAKKNILSKKTNQLSYQITKNTSHSDFRSDQSTATLKNTHITKMSFIKNQTPVNYLTILEEEDPNENEDNGKNPFLHY